MLIYKDEVSYMQKKTNTETTFSLISSYKLQRRRVRCHLWVFTTLTPTPNATKYKFLENRSRY